MISLNKFSICLILSTFSCLTLSSGQTGDRSVEFVNCGTNGLITDINITNCEESSCSFYPGDELTLDYDFFADTGYDKLDFYLNLIDQENEENVFPVRYTKGTVQVVANVSQSSHIRVILNDTVPHDKMWDMEISRVWMEKEICARFPVQINPIEVTETTTPKQTTTLAPPEDEFECEGIGLFPDPFDCTIFHECQLFLNGSLWDTVFTCPDFTVWCQETKDCEFDSDCHCEIELFHLF